MNRTISLIVICLGLAGCATCRTVVHDDMTESRLDQIIVPEIAFRSATMSDIVDFLHDCSLPIGYDPPAIRQIVSETEVTYFIPVPPPTDPAVKSPGEMWAQTTLQTFGPSVTLSGRDMSLLAIYRQVARLGATRFDIQKNMIMIKTRKVQPAGEYALPPGAQP